MTYKRHKCRFGKSMMSTMGLMVSTLGTRNDNAALQFYRRGLVDEFSRELKR